MCFCSLVTKMRRHHGEVLPHDKECLEAAAKRKGLSLAHEVAQVKRMGHRPLCVNGCICK
jgi:hypothetical protein